MYVHGIEAIKLYMPPTDTQIDTDIKEEKGREELQETNMSSVERYGQEWKQLLHCLDENAESIRDQAFNGDLKVSKFRSLYWTLLLRVLNADYQRWHEQRQQQRQRYERLKQEFIKNPHEVEVPDDNPLSQSQQSVWNQFFSDQELFAVIRQDVVRTFPGVDFFRKTIIQNAMSNILFYYAREHPYMCYRQGMHEILAPILFVMYSDHQSLLHFTEIAKNAHIDNILSDVLNPNYLEADSYSIFSRLMSSIESYYRIKNFPQNQSGYVLTQAQVYTETLKPVQITRQLAAFQSTNGTNVEVLGQLNSIRDKILAKEDLHLHNYLLKLDIPLHIFGIRWLRLLFGREFALLDLLVVWDAIFADSDRFDLPNYILVAMLIRIRQKLLLSDQTTCLTYLMRYPANVDVNLIIRHALHMLMPKKFDLPSNAFVYCTITQQRQLQQQLQQQQLLLQTPTLPSSAAAKSRGTRHPSQAVDSQHERGDAQRGRSTSLGDAAAQLERQISLLQAHNAAEAAATARLNLDGVETNHSVMEGYSKNSPELLRLELKNAQTVISIARNKLLTYLSVIRRHVSRSSADELVQALDGIEELCSFLDVKFMFPMQSSAAPIDQALEADEQQRLLKSAAKQSRKESERAPVVNTEVAPVTSSKATALTAGSLSESATVIEQSSILSSSPATYSNTGFSYERPDNSYMLNSTRRLGNLREIELITIAPSEKVEEPLDLPLSDPLRQHKDDELYE